MSRKRGNGEGSISRRKGGGWMAQYTIHTAEGRKRKTIYGKTRQEVAGKLAKALSDHGRVVHDGTRITAAPLSLRARPGPAQAWSCRQLS